MTITLEEVQQLAKAAHAGQSDLQGRDYYTHHLLPIAGTLLPLGEHAVMAGLLHDIVEDTAHWGEPVTLEALREQGVPEDVVAAIDSVTRRPDEPYEDLIARSCADPLGVHIKIADNQQNILANPGLAQVDPVKAERLLRERYLPARDRLIEARLLRSLGLDPAATS